MDNISPNASSLSGDDDNNLLYENGTYITCRNASDSFYLCQVLQNVYTYTKIISIRWCTPVDEDGDNTKISTKTIFKFDYKDKLDPNTILMNIPDIIHHKNDDTVSLKKQHIVDTKRLLEKSIRNESLSSDDMMDLSTEHQYSKKKQLNHIHFPSSNESDSSSSTELPIEISSKSTKRKKVLDKKKTRKEPAKKRQRTKDISELSDGENESVKPKKKRISFNRNNSN